MNDEVLNKLNQEEQINMLKEIDKNYADLKLPVINPIYDKNGNLKNEKEIKEKLKLFIIIISALWLANITILDKHSKNTIINTYAFYNALKKEIRKITVTELKELSKDTMSTEKWNKIMDKIILDRQKKIKIKQVLKGNIDLLNKRVQNTVQDMYRTGKSKPQIAKELETIFNYNKNKAKSIALTEVNWYKSEAQLEATNGLKIKKTWIHNKARDPRETHVAMNGKSVIGRDTYFNVGGLKTKAPQHFGIPSEDINCHCTMRIEVIE